MLSFKILNNPHLDIDHDHLYFIWMIFHVLKILKREFDEKAHFSYECLSKDPACLYITMF